MYDDEMCIRAGTLSVQLHYEIKMLEKELAQAVMLECPISEEHKVEYQGHAEYYCKWCGRDDSMNKNGRYTTA